MTDWSRRFRQHIAPRAAFLARGAAEPPRASSLICGMMIVVVLLAMLAKALTHLRAAT